MNGLRIGDILVKLGYLDKEQLEKALDRQKIAGVYRIRTYVWEFPVRLYHWINVVSIVLLSITGFYIGNPFLHAFTETQYTMGTMRFIHFVCGYAFFTSFLIRMYWAFAGNEYASWRVWFPFTKKRLADIKATLKFYTFMSTKLPRSIGHMAFSGFAYLIIFIVYAYMIFSGFALYSLPTPDSTYQKILGGWLLGISDIQALRHYHHIGMYVIFIFISVHLYVSWWLDTIERNAIIGSIFDGYKFITSKWE